MMRQDWTVIEVITPAHPDDPRIIAEILCDPGGSFGFVWRDDGKVTLIGSKQYRPEQQAWVRSVGWVLTTGVAGVEVRPPDDGHHVTKLTNPTEREVAVLKAESLRWVDGHLASFALWDATNKKPFREVVPRWHRSQSLDLGVWGTASCEWF